MIFTNDKPIYLQMADRLCDEILSGVYKDDDRIPSVVWDTLLPQALVRLFCSSVANRL